MYFGIVTFTINTVQIKSFNVPLHRAKFFKEDYIEKRDHGKSVLPRYTDCRLWVASAGVAVATEAQFSGPSANAACLADRSIQDSSIIDAPLKNIYTHTHAFRSVYGYICPVLRMLSKLKLTSAIFSVARMSRDLISGSSTLFTCRWKLYVSSKIMLTQVNILYVEY